jgi:hypothetical protein
MLTQSVRSRVPARWTKFSLGQTSAPEIAIASRSIAKAGKENRDHPQQ